ncbi:unnamed protein product [Brachionus calyciflorus]|uniref:Uncharacterized protein n=1 Tax=Brachionus calyciflorus TaxID=104777 RepID=A0A814LU86_9BILA|nr:unnamed protein product [Brachionus calyciflorus]
MESNGNFKNPLKNILDNPQSVLKGCDDSLSGKISRTDNQDQANKAQRDEESSDIGIEFKLIEKNNSQGNIKFLLYPDKNELIFQSKFLPNVKFEVRRSFRPLNDPTEHSEVNVSLYEQDIVKRSKYVHDLENFVKKETLIITSDRSMDEKRFQDLNNKMIFSLHS